MILFKTQIRTQCLFGQIKDSLNRFQIRLELFRSDCLTPDDFDNSTINEEIIAIFTFQEILFSNVYSAGRSSLNPSFFVTESNPSPVAALISA